MFCELVGNMEPVTGMFHGTSELGCCNGSGTEQARSWPCCDVSCTMTHSATMGCSTRDMLLTWDV
jgi:hypothetical protein